MSSLLTLMRAGRRGAFSPASIPGLALWPDASQMTLANGDPVSILPDRSAFARHGTASGLARPTCTTGGLNGLRTVHFDASDDMLDFGTFLSGASALSLVVLWRAPFLNGMSFALSKHGTYAANDGEWVVRIGGSINYLMSQQFENASGVYHSGVTTSISGPDNWQISTVTWAASTNPLHYGNEDLRTLTSGSNWSSVSALPASSYTVRLGFLPGFAGPSGGDVAEFMIVNGVLGAAGRLALVRYLKRKWFTRQVICDGNSLTAGSSSGTVATNYLPYPTQLGPLLTNTHLLYNFGVGGQGTPAMTADAVTQVDPLYEPGFAKNIVIAWEGTNEMAFSATSAATALASMSTYCQARRAAGFIVGVLPVLPRSDVSVVVDFETKRQAYNTSMASGFSAYADFYVALPASIVNPGAETNTANYLTDLVHLNNTGAGGVAAAVAAAVNAL